MCKIMALMAVIMGLGLLFYILFGVQVHTFFLGTLCCARQDWRFRALKGEYDLVFRCWGLVDIGFVLIRILSYSGEWLFTGTEMALNPD